MQLEAELHDHPDRPERPDVQLIQVVAGHVLDHSAAFNVIPKRYVGQGLSPLDVYFAMGRGRQADGVDVPASEMKKW